jgi:hypothetical protein
VSTREAVVFGKSAGGFPTNKTVETIAPVANKILVLRIRDAITALSQAFPILGCSGPSTRPEKKRGTRSGAMGDASTLN